MTPHDPLEELFSDPAQLLRWSEKRGELLERVVEALFRRLPHWKASRPSSTNTPDRGVDIVVISPLGKRFLVQCKDLSNPVPREVVSQAYGDLQLNKLDEAIVISPSGFSEPAQLAAQELGVRLWGPEELKLLFQAAKSERALRALGLWEQPPERRTIWDWLSSFLPRFGISRRLGLAVLVVGGVLLVGVLGSKIVPKRTPERVVVGYDKAYRHALSTNDIAPLYDWAFREYVDQKVLPFIRERQERGCVLLTKELSPLLIRSVSYDDINVEVQVSKHWRQTLRCPNKPDRIVLEKPFDTFYLLRVDKGLLKVWYGEWN